MEFHYQYEFILGLVAHYRLQIKGPDFDLARSHFFVEIDHKIFSIVILLLQLIQEGFCQLQAKVCAQCTG